MVEETKIRGKVLEVRGVNLINRDKHMSNSMNLHADCGNSTSIVFRDTSLKFEGLLLMEPIPSLRVNVVYDSEFQV